MRTNLLRIPRRQATASRTLSTFCQQTRWLYGNLRRPTKTAVQRQTRYRGQCLLQEASLGSQALHSYREPVPFVGLGEKEHKASITEPSSQHARTKKSGVIPKLSKRQLRDPETWITLMERYVPRHLHASSSNQNRWQQRPNALASQDLAQDCEDILSVLETARRVGHAEVDILVHMIMHGRREAGIHILEMLLKNVSTRFPARPSQTTPSNVIWPQTSLDDMCCTPIEATAPPPNGTDTVHVGGNVDDDPRYAFSLSSTRDVTMTEVWSVLGTLVIQSTNLIEVGATQLLNVVMLIIGRIHNLDLVPDNVYTYRPSVLTTAVQRPPILHLVSSRILTALSDAAWRNQQLQTIEKAAELGVSYAEIARDAPGGRFRLKVRPLAPEIWLEFILWCCAEGGFATAGMRIVKCLSEQENPWFGVTWTPAAGSSRIAPLVDWDRVRLRHGGSVGLIEGYSREKPFVEMPARTVSTEVILSLVNCSIDTVNCGQARGLSLEIVQKYISDWISFLEPHDLPVAYFDYLAVRLLQSEAFDLPHDATVLQNWYNKLCSIKSLEPANPRPNPQISFQLDALALHTELFAGIVHQILHGHVQRGDIHQALNAFNILQELVDTSKLKAIGTFLKSGAPAYSSGFFTGVPRTEHNDDFVGSHGQLPLYKLAALLDLANDTGLAGFGEWLLYSEDPDGPMIPPSVYADPSIRLPLLRLASLANDAGLRTQVLIAQASTDRKKTVRFLRALVNTNISNMNFAGCWKPLLELKDAKGGGCGLDNISYLAGTILKIEAELDRNIDATANARQSLEEATSLLDNILDGAFNTSVAAFRTKIRARYKQHIAALLRVFQFYPDSQINTVASRHVNKYPLGNMSDLPARIFNLFMEAAIDAKGAGEGIRLWEQFCEIPRGSSGETDVEFMTEDDVFEPSALDDEFGVSESSSNGLSNDGEELRQHGSPRQAHAAGSQTQASLIDDAASPVTARAICVADQRTLRLIVRRAVRDRSNLQARQGNVLQDKDEVIDWALRQFARFGISRRMIETEIQERLSDVQISSLNLRNFRVTPIRRRLSSPPTPVRRYLVRPTDVTKQFGFAQQSEA